MKVPFSILAYYKFTGLPTDAEELRSALYVEGQRLGIRGLLILAPEGVNATVAGEPASIREWQRLMEGRFGPITFKLAGAEEQPFRRWSVKIRPEIVTLGSDVHPPTTNNHLSPQEWHGMLQSEDVVVLDARNTYETEIGMFEGAVDPKIVKFSEFPEFIAKGEISKDKKVLMYCTGGIRCEKAAKAMQEQGYEHVYQLKGGILKYLEEFPEGAFKGECFVFDHRVAVDTRLQPSKNYRLCPHCGDPGDQRIGCAHCNKECTVCSACHAQDLRTCSKNCAHHVQRRQPALSR